MMEEPNGDNHSDSDSIDSWTIVDKKTNEPNDAEISEQSDNSKLTTEVTNIKAEEDTDTDGVSIISDEEADAATVKMEEDSSICYRNEKIDIPIHDVFQNEMKQNNPPPQYTKESVNNLDSVSTATIRGSEEELCDDFFTDAKVRSYIHKRNNKLSAVLNTVLIGAIITTACLAIGHMWGTTDDCSPDMYSSLSQLVYNMQELQHENYILKSKLKVLESKNSRPNQVPLSLYQAENYRKLSQNFIDLNAKEQTESFLKLEKTICQCVNDDNIAIIPKNVTNSENFEENEAVQLNGTTGEFDIKIEIDDALGLNSMLNNEYLPQPYATRKMIRNQDDSKKVYKRSIPSGHHNMFVGPKTYDVHLNEHSGSRYKNKNAFYPKNNVSHLNKKYAEKEKKKYDKYAKETLKYINKKNTDNDHYKKALNQKVKSGTTESVNENKNYKYPEATRKYRGNEHNKDMKRDKYKVKDYKLKREQNFQYKDNEPKKDIYKDEIYNKDKKGKMFLKV